MLRKNYISKIMIILGVVTIISSFVDFAVLLFPLQLKSSEWVFEISQIIAEKSIIPILGIVIVFGGLYIDKNSDKNKLTLVSESALSLLSLLFSRLIEDKQEKV